MPRNSRGKAAKTPKPKREPTQFGELDTTPTSRHLRSNRTRKLATDDSPTEVIGLNPSSGVEVHASPVQPSSPEEFDDGVDDVDLVKLVCPEDNTLESRVQDFNWSEGESLPKRSSPLRAEDGSQSLWEFDERDSNPFSSPRSGLNKLPDTVPLPRDPSLDTQSRLRTDARGPVDFSETASTMRRSSPLVPQTSIAGNWEFNQSSPRTGPLESPSITQEAKTAHSRPSSTPPLHLPMDEIYDATPPRSRQKQKHFLAQSKGTTGHPEQKQNFSDPTPPQTLQKAHSIEKPPLKRKRAMKELLDDELASDGEEPTPCPGKTQPQEEGASLFTTDKSGCDVAVASQVSPAAAQESTQGRKRKQRAKTPIQFDEATREIKQPLRKKKTTVPPKPAAVSALRNETKPSMSPISSAKKRPAPKVAPKPGPAKKKRKVPPRKEQPKRSAKNDTGKSKSSISTRSVKLKEAMARGMEENAPNQENTGVDENAWAVDIVDVAPFPIVISSDEEASSPLKPPTPESKAQNLDLVVKSTHGPLLPEPQSPLASPLSSKKSLPNPATEATPAVDIQSLDSHQQNINSREPVETMDVSRLGKRTTRSTKKAAIKQTIRATTLAPRDPNRTLGRVQQSPKHKVLEKIRTVDWPEMSSSRPLRKTGKMSRSFSISEAGSPVPVRSDPVPFTADSTPPSRSHEILKD
ncbi:hypothetical protein B0J13DRAFT_287853 [Dactylonectria estremocensis]|uniref:Uncharacterized protein n=1 Tax=Dactylonectria estremocensis TaxID=1079267 RepID=A0A9P9EYZ8_9HYPO|nr:hypothetical protein B0J13DRAFT_287853 [Dactylonectria estremocensis]